MADPAFTHQQRIALFQDLIERGWTVPIQGAFIGGWQPFAPRKFPPALLSVDKPIFTHFSRRPIYQEIIKAWEPPPPQPFIGGLQPLAPRKLMPSLLSVDSPPAYLPELLILPAEDNAAYFRSQHWPKIAATLVPVVTSTANWSSAGAATSNFVGLATSADQPPGFAWKLISSDDSVQYYQIQKKVAATLSQGTSQSSNWTSTGVATAVFNGVAADAADWSSTGVGLAQFGGLTLFPSAWTATGVGVAQFNGSSADAAAWNSIGVGTAVWNEASFASADWNSAGVGLASWVGQALQPGASDWLSTGTSTASWTNQSTASSAWSSAGRSTAQFKGAGGSASTVTRDGWRLKAQQLERRKRKDEEEIMAIAKAVLPLLRRGIKAPMRISL